MPNAAFVRQTPEQRRTRARAAWAASRGHQKLADDLRRELKVERLADHIRELVDAWPPLTPEQRRELALILHAPSGDDAA